MTQHTPGPWCQASSIIWAGGDRGGTICVVGEPRATAFVQYTPLALSSPDFEEAIANARLIAAAPDLLAALRELVADHEQTAENSHTGSPRPWREEWAIDEPLDWLTVQRARAAIARATNPELPG